MLTQCLEENPHYQIFGPPPPTKPGQPTILILLVLLCRNFLPYTSVRQSPPTRRRRLLRFLQHHLFLRVPSALLFPLYRAGANCRVKRLPPNCFFTARVGPPRGKRKGKKNRQSIGPLLLSRSFTLPCPQSLPRIASVRIKFRPATTPGQVKVQASLAPDPEIPHSRLLHSRTLPRRATLSSLRTTDIVFFWHTSLRPTAEVNHGHDGFLGLERARAWNAHRRRR